MFRRLIPLVATALLWTAAPAHAWTVSVDTTANCTDGSLTPPSLPTATDTPSHSPPSAAAGGKFSASTLTVEAGKTLTVLSDGSDTDCAVAVTGAVSIAGTLRHELKDRGGGGNLSLTSAQTIGVPASGAVSAGGKDATGGASSVAGGKGGKVLLRAPVLSVAGAVRANGGSGSAGTAVAIDGGDGGLAGTVTIIVDGAAEIATGTFEAKGGTGGAPGTGGVPPATGKAGAAGGGGTVRRNAISGAAAGTVTAASKPVNQAPTGLGAAGAAVGVQLTWSDNADEETGYTVVRRERGGSYKTVGTAAAGVTSFNDTGPFEGGKTYEYAVLATFSDAIWPLAFTFSNLASIDVPAPRAPPAAAPPKKPATKPGGGGGGKTGSTPFSIDLNFPGSYKLARSAEFLKLKIRTFGDGRLLVGLRLRVAGKRGRKRGHPRGRPRSRLLRKTFPVNRGTNLLRLRLPSRVLPGSYPLSLTTVSARGQTRSFKKRIRISFRR